MGGWVKARKKIIRLSRRRTYLRFAATLWHPQTRRIVTACEILAEFRASNKKKSAEGRQSEGASHPFRSGGVRSLAARGVTGGAIPSPLNPLPRPTRMSRSARHQFCSK